MKQYYIPYDETKDINYIYVLAFYKAATYNKLTKRYDTISYRSLSNLSEQIKSVSNKKISVSTLGRILKDSKYSMILSVPEDRKAIIIKNDIKSLNKFVVLSEKEADLLLDKDDILLAKYLLYLKYFCGYSKSKKINTTAKQFLLACGYSTNSNDYISRISEFNRLLVDQGIIKIEKYRDDNGNERNSYSLA